MRTSIQLPEDLVSRARQIADRQDQTLDALIEGALRESLARQAEKVETRAARVSLPTFRGKGLQPGVDLSDRAAVLDRMEGLDDPAGR